MPYGTHVDRELLACGLIIIEKTNYPKDQDYQS